MTNFIAPSEKVNENWLSKNIQHEEIQGNACFPIFFLLLFSFRLSDDFVKHKDNNERRMWKKNTKIITIYVKVKTALSQ